MVRLHRLLRLSRIAAKSGWKDGVFELLRNEASLTATDRNGLNARQHAERNKKTSVVDMIDEWLREDDDAPQDTFATQRKREDIEASKVSGS